MIAGFPRDFCQIGFGEYLEEEVHEGTRLATYTCICITHWLIIRCTSLIGAYFLLNTCFILVPNSTLLSACTEGAETDHVANLQL